MQSQLERERQKLLLEEQRAEAARKAQEEAERERIRAEKRAAKERRREEARAKEAEAKGRKDAERNGKQRQQQQQNTQHEMQRQVNGGKMHGGDGGMETKMTEMWTKLY